MQVEKLERDLRYAVKHMLDSQQQEVFSASIIAAMLDAMDHEVFVLDKMGRVQYLNRLSKTHLFTGLAVNIRSHKSLQIEDLISHLEKEYDIEGRTKLQELMDSTKGEFNFVTASAKIALTKSRTKIYEVITNPIYDRMLGYLGRIWQFRDVTTEEKLDEMKTEFISLASHQLRTPLTSIRGYTDMVLSGDYGELPAGPMREALEAVAVSGKDMSELVDELLNLGRLEKGGAYDLQLAEVPLANLLTEVVSELSAFASNRQQQIVVENTLPIDFKFTTDRRRLGESLKNLLHNGLKYSNSGQKVLLRVTKDGEQLQIHVEDHGIGIPSDQQAQIFTKFFRAANVLTENFSGTGIGLYYVKRAITDLKGRIDFSSQVGEGTVFNIYLTI
jgi:signal transduction histidine kinase